MIAATTIFVGYAALVASFGLPGLVCAALHIMMMVVAARKLGRSQ